MLRFREIAHTGIFGATDTPTNITDSDLAELVETFDEMNPVPIWLLHDLGATPAPGSPRLGSVIALELRDGHVYATVREHDALTKAVADGYYPERSIGAKRRASDGKLYLHHLAYLGEEPPGIKDLKRTIYDSLAIAASDRDGLIHLPPVGGAGRIALGDTEDQGACMDEELKKRVAALEAENRALKDAAARGPGAPDEKTAALEKENAALKARLASLAEKYPDEDIALADSHPQVRTLYGQLRKTKRDALFAAARTKVPAAILDAKLGALADNLALADSIALADGKKISAIDLATEIFAAMPEPSWAHEVIHLSDPENKQQRSVSAATMMGCI